MINSRRKADTHFKFIFFVKLKERHKIDFFLTFEDLFLHIAIFFQHLKQTGLCVRDCVPKATELSRCFQKLANFFMLQL